MGPSQAVGEGGARVGVGVAEEVGAAPRVTEVVEKAEGRAELDRFVVFLRGYDARDARDLQVGDSIRSGSKRIEWC